MRPSGSLPIRPPCRGPALSGSARAARRREDVTAREPRRPPRGDRAPRREPAGTRQGTSPLSALCRTARLAARLPPVLGRDVPDGPALSGLTGTLSQVRARRSDDQRSLRACPRRPGDEPARIAGPTSGSVSRDWGGRFVLRTGQAWQDRSRPRPVAVRQEGHRYGNVPRRPPHPLKVFARVQQGL